MQNDTQLAFKIFKSKTAFLNMKETWTLLLERSNNPTLYQTWEWLTTWWEVYGDERHLCIVAGYHNNELIGIAPLSMPRKTTRHYNILPYKTLWYLSSGQTNGRNIATEYTDFIIQKGKEHLFISNFVHWISKRHFWDDIIIPDMSSESPTLSILKKAAQKCRLNIGITSTAQSLLIKLPHTWNDYLTSVTRSLRYKISRGRKELARSSGQYYRINSQKEIPQAFAELERLHQYRWRSKGESGAFSSSHWKSFHRNIMPVLCRKRWMKLSFLKLAGENVAANYNFVFNKKVHYFQSGIIPQHNKHLRLGLILHSYCIEEAINEGMQEYDFLKYWPGSSDYKIMWCNYPRGLATIRLSRQTSKETVNALFLKMHHLLRKGKSGLYPVITSHNRRLSVK